MLNVKKINSQNNIIFQQPIQKRSGTSGLPADRNAQSMYSDDGTNAGNSNPDPGFTVPILNRPLQFQDYQMLERLVVESIDVYNKWQKKPANSNKDKP